MSLNESNEDSYFKGRKYWETIEPNMNGMLGGYTNVHVWDVDESRQLLKRLFAKMDSTYLKDKSLIALDCGAGTVFLKIFFI